MEMGKEFQKQAARMTKDLLEEVVLKKGIYKSIDRDLVFRYWIEEHEVKSSTRCTSKEWYMGALGNKPKINEQFILWKNS